MDIFEIQALIAKQRILKTGDFDPTEAYLQLGLFQHGNRNNGAGNADSYKSYVIPVSELGGGTPPLDNKNFVLVDFVFGNDGTAQKYNMFLPYQTINAAILAAVPGDVIVVNPAPTFSYFVTVNMFIPGVDFYIWEGATVFVFVNPIATSGSQDINILGNGDLRFFAYSLLGGTYTGNLTIECDFFTANANSYYGGDFSGDVKITVNQKLTLGPGGTAFYWDNPGYYSIATTPNRFIMNVNEVEIFGTIFVLHAESVELNFNIKKYRYMGLGGAFAKDFFKFGTGTTTFPTTNYINIDDFVCDKSLSGYSDCVFYDTALNPQGKVFITGNYVYKGNGSAVQVPCFLNPANCAETIHFNGIANIIKGSMLVDLNSASTCKVIIEGNVYVDNSLIAFSEYLFSAYFIGSLSAKIKADTIIDSPNNIGIQIGTYTIGGTPQIDIIDCQIVNKDIVGLSPALVAKGFNAFAAPAGPYGTLRIINSRLVTTGTTSIQGASVGEPIEIVTAYSNKPTVSIATTVPAMPGIFVDAALSSNNF